MGSFMGAQPSLGAILSTSLEIQWSEAMVFRKLYIVSKEDVSYS
jgi:hypothetical protein